MNSSPHKGSKYFLQVQGEEDAVPSAPQNLWWKPWKKETSKKLLKLVVVETKIYICIGLLGLYHVIMPIIIIRLVLQAGKMKQILGPDWLPEQKRRRKKKVLSAI